MRVPTTQRQGIPGNKFAVLVEYGCVDRAIANLGYRRLARVFNGVRNAFPELSPARVADIVYGAVEELRANAHRYRAHRSLSHYLFSLAYNRAL